MQVSLTPYDEQREAEQCLIAAQVTRWKKKKNTSKASELENNLSHCNFAADENWLSPNCEQKTHFCILAIKVWEIPQIFN